MSTARKQREIVNKKLQKVEDLQNKVLHQELIFHAQNEVVQDLTHEKRTMERQLGLLEVTYEDALALFQRNQRRLAVGMSGVGAGATGTYERDARRDLEERRQQCRGLEDGLKAVARGIEKAERAQDRAREKRDGLQVKLDGARAELRVEQARLLRFPHEQQQQPQQQQQQRHRGR
ncbi:hypothetical protein SAMD00023353_6000300 [Rosellinia necatrix]|uniref:Uncharacterized protein n=1 Tax=Rosellinia necatrix TaxID=77044 RepID=A0A1W2TAN1_ROSNE|nr:hypothetical protein SAMD00023353_6000300 [Rosellinia necatrix]